MAVSASTGDGKTRREWRAPEVSLIASGSNTRGRALGALHSATEMTVGYNDAIKATHSTERAHTMSPGESSGPGVDGGS